MQGMKGWQINASAYEDGEEHLYNTTKDLLNPHVLIASKPGKRKEACAIESRLKRRQSHPPIIKNSVPASHATRRRSSVGRFPYNPVNTRSNNPCFSSCPGAPIFCHFSEARYCLPEASTSADGRAIVPSPPDFWSTPTTTAGNAPCDPLDTGAAAGAVAAAHQRYAPRR